MDQNKFVLWANKQHQFVDETFEDAHFPLPKDLGTETIKLHHLDHAIQGLFQSEEVGRRCFYNGDTYKALYKTPNYFPLGWFEACDLFEKWTKLDCNLTYESRSRGTKNSNHKKYGKVEKMAAARRKAVKLLNVESLECFYFEKSCAAANFLGVSPSVITSMKHNPKTKCCDFVVVT